jgi:hypothetical protein
LGIGAKDREVTGKCLASDHAIERITMPGNQLRDDHLEPGQLGERGDQAGRSSRSHHSLVIVLFVTGFVGLSVLSPGLSALDSLLKGA